MRSNTLTRVSNNPGAIQCSDMTFQPLGGGSRIVSLWEMLRFHADKFIEVLNLLNSLEILMQQPGSQLKNMKNVDFFVSQVEQLHGQLEDLGLPVSAKKADQIRIALTLTGPDERSSAWGHLITGYCKELRERVAHELEGRAIYYVSDHVDLLSESPLFGDHVDEAFPSAQYDISEAGRCLAFRRQTACVVHLMRALEFGLSNLATTLGMNLTNKNWDTIINDIEKEVRSRNKGSHGEKWKNEDEPFFSEAAAHFRLIKNAWRNHAAHARTKYTDEEAKEIYESVRAFMRHLSQRLSE